MMALFSETKKRAVPPSFTKAEATLIIDELWTISDNFNVANDTQKYRAILKLLSEISKRIPN